VGGLGAVGGFGGLGGLGGNGGNGNTGVALSGSGNTIWNSGTILGGDAGGITSAAGSGILLELGATAEISNLGFIAGGSAVTSSYGIENKGNISRLRNGQGGDVEALTYWGDLPGAYEVIINSAKSYGQLVVSGGGSGQVTTVEASSLTVAATGSYHDVISGVTAAGIANEGVVTAGGHGVLSVLSDAALRADGAAEAWDLNILNFGHDMAEPQTFFLKQNWLAVRRTLDYDCDLFDKNGVCVALLSQYNSYDGKNIGGGNYGELSGTLLGAKRLTEKVRVGGFLDWRFDGDDIDGINSIDRLPIVGGFVGYSQAADGLGLQARLAVAHEHGSADFSHANLLGSAASASGEASVDTYGVGAEVAWGIALKDQQVIMPYVSMNYVDSTRDDYRDESAGGTVEDQFSYESYSAAYTTATLGFRLQGAITDKIDYTFNAGVESVLGGDTDKFEVRGEFGDASYQSRNGLSDWSLDLSAGITYKVDDFKAVMLSSHLRQMEDGVTHSGVSLGYKMGF
jgi:hypothetical protein